jgi:hypothetical protein
MNTHPHSDILDFAKEVVRQALLHHGLSYKRTYQCHNGYKFYRILCHTHSGVTYDVCMQRALKTIRKALQDLGMGVACEVRDAQKWTFDTSSSSLWIRTTFKTA